MAEEFKKAFDEIDTEKCGRLTGEQLKEFDKYYPDEKPSAEEIADVENVLKNSGDGKISWEELAAISAKHHGG